MSIEANKKRDGDKITTAEVEARVEKARQRRYALSKEGSSPSSSRRVKGKYAKPFCRLCKAGKLEVDWAYMQNDEGYYARRKVCDNPKCGHKIFTYEFYPWSPALIALRALQDQPLIAKTKVALTLRRLTESAEAMISNGRYDKREKPEG